MIEEEEEDGRNAAWGQPQVGEKQERRKEGALSWTKKTKGHLAWPPKPQLLQKSGSRERTVTQRNLLLHELAERKGYREPILCNYR